MLNGQSCGHLSQKPNKQSNESGVSVKLLAVLNDDFKVIDLFFEVNKVFYNILFKQIINDGSVKFPRIYSSCHGRHCDTRISC